MPIRKSAAKKHTLVFTNGQGEWDSIPGRVIPDSKMYLIPLLTYKVCIKGSGAIQGKE